MDKQELRQLLHILELDYEAEPLVYVFYQTPDGTIHNFSVSIRVGRKLDNSALEKLMRKEYPDTRQGTVMHIERPSMSQRVQEAERFLWADANEACQLLHISQRTLERWTRRGVFRCTKIGKRIYYNRQDIDQALELHMVNDDGTIDTTAVQALEDMKDYGL